jgi:vacuolar-type H+-ATPase subunit I/STV1
MDEKDVNKYLEELVGSLSDEQSVEAKESKFVPWEAVGWFVCGPKGISIKSKDYPYPTAYPKMETTPTQPVGPSPKEKELEVKITEMTQKLTETEAKLKESTDKLSEHEKKEVELSKKFEEESIAIKADFSTKIDAMTKELTDKTAEIEKLKTPAPSRTAELSAEKTKPLNFAEALLAKHRK